MANNTTNGTGLPPPTMQGRTGSPAQAAYNNNKQVIQSQADLIQVSSGGSKKKRGGAITVPTVQPMYKEVSGPGGTVTDTQVNTASSSANSLAQAKYDNQLGGGKRGKKGGNPNWLWGCYSGGKRKKTRTNKRKTRRYRKKTRRNKK